MTSVKNVHVIGIRTRAVAVMAVVAALALGVAAPSYATHLPTVDDTDPGRRNVYHVSVRGHDQAPLFNENNAIAKDCSGGTVSNPWRTIRYSFRCLDPGDVLYMRDGIYDEDVTWAPVRAGTKDKPILVASYPRERPVIKGVLYTSRYHYWTFDGINITRDPTVRYNNGQPLHIQQLLIMRDGVGWTFRNGEIWGAPAIGGAYLSGTGNYPGEPADWRFEGNCVHDTTNYHDKGMDHNMYVSTKLGSGSGLISRNLLYGAPGGYNIKLGVSSDVNDGDRFVTIAHNTMHNAISNVIVVGKSNNNTIERNLMGGINGPQTVAPFYPHIYGYTLSGDNNVARDNRAYGPLFGNQGIVHENDTSTRHIADIGNSALDPQFHTGSCSAFRPGNSAARAFGRTGLVHQPLVGDFDPDRGQQRSTPAVVEDGTWRLRLSNDVGVARQVLTGFGGPMDQYLLGDWDGNGVDTPAYVRGDRWVFRQTLTGTETRAFEFGPQHGRFTPVVGDWNGDGTDTVGYVIGRTWVLRMERGGTVSFDFGCSGGAPVAGRWNPNIVGDAPGMVCDGEWRRRNHAEDRPSEILTVFNHGVAGDEFVAGDWNGDGLDEAGAIHGGSLSATSPWVGSLWWALRVPTRAGWEVERFSYDG